MRYYEVFEEIPKQDNDLYFVSKHWTNDFLRLIVRELLKISQQERIDFAVYCAEKVFDHYDVATRTVSEQIWQIIDRSNVNQLKSIAASWLNAPFKIKVPKNLDKYFDDNYLHLKAPPEIKYGTKEYTNFKILTYGSYLLTNIIGQYYYSSENMEALAEGHVILTCAMYWDDLDDNPYKNFLEKCVEDIRMLQGKPTLSVQNPSHKKFIEILKNQIIPLLKNIDSYNPDQSDIIQIAISLEYLQEKIEDEYIKLINFIGKHDARDNVDLAKYLVRNKRKFIPLLDKYNI